MTIPLSISFVCQNQHSPLVRKKPQASFSPHVRTCGSITIFATTAGCLSTLHPGRAPCTWEAIFGHMDFHPIGISKVTTFPHHQSWGHPSHHWHGQGSSSGHSSGISSSFGVGLDFAFAFPFPVGFPAALAEAFSSFRFSDAKPQPEDWRNPSWPYIVGIRDVIGSI